LRVCADKNASEDTGVITESNEGNNCGEWTAVSVTSSLTASCDVSPTSAGTGENVTWTATASGGSGGYTYDWSGSTAPLAGSGNPKVVQSGHRYLWDKFSRSDCL
jgi:hypothetical protein